MEYIKKRGNYFITESGKSWTPIGYNDSYTWPSMQDEMIEDHFKKLNEKNITCIRMMFEYADHPDSFLENPMGVFNETVVNKWKRIFALCEQYNIRLLMSAYDTFWQWINWDRYPYNVKNGGYLEHIHFMLSDPKTIDIHKNRFRFLIENFSNSGVIFAWDIWNEIHPNMSNKTDEGFETYMKEISAFIKETEINLYGKSHLQTCSIFHPAVEEFKHLDLGRYIYTSEHTDFCNVHMYMLGTIDDPKNTTDAAVDVGRLTVECLKEITDGRPFFDSETGPIHSFNDKHITLDEAFDNEYHLNMSWAHLASGGVGAGFRWPYRVPHSITDGMIDNLSSVSKFCTLVNWNKFLRTNLTDTILYSNRQNVKLFACGTNNKFILFFLRTDNKLPNGLQNPKTPAININVSIPNVDMGLYKIVSWKADQQLSSLALQQSVRGKNGHDLNFGAQVKRSLILYIENGGV